MKQTPLHMRIWWWIGYHGLYQIDWWLRKHWYLDEHGKTTIKIPMGIRKVLVTLLVVTSPIWIIPVFTLLALYGHFSLRNYEMRMHE